LQIDMRFFDSRQEMSSYLKNHLKGKHYCYALYHNDLPFYIGKSCRPERVMQHEIDALNKKNINTFKESKIRKLLRRGERIKYALIAEFTSQLEVDNAEKSLILFYGKIIDSSGILTNILDGGEGAAGRAASDKQKEAIRKHMIGKPKTSITRQRLSDSIKEHYKHNSGTFTGRQHSEETKSLMSVSQTGEKNHSYGKRGSESHNYGRKHSEETKKKISLGQDKENMAWSEEDKARLRDYWSNQPLMTCPHCGKASSFKASMVRAHFDNCKHSLNKQQDSSCKK
jgi:hypothetical protein